jgi:chromosome segregation protein
VYLKALEIQGFKSFPDKTRLNFDQEITAIVGPNGSGKSNISDAILWVMGEQRTKTLRGGKMEDVIFGGTEKRSPMGFAQVSLILDNSTGIFDTENTEVMITRRYYRSGESEYSINREPCRLRDINELLMDTGLGRDGYSIIGQGRIAEIVSGKSNERREIFEEAAGISRYRYRKEESERKLARTEENLLRINDKVDELELQVEPLRKQAETAKKYLHLRDELKSAEVSVWMETLDRLHAQAETVNHDYQTAKENLAGAQRELEQLYAASENIAQKMREKDLESERTREQISEAESAAAECESAAAVVRTNLQNSADSIARLRVEVSEQADRASALQAQIDAQQRRLQEIEAEKAQHAQEIRSVLDEIDRNAASSGEAERAYTELLARESAQSSALAECRTRITLLADKSQELLDQENAIVTAAAAERLAALEAQAQEKQTAQQQALSACDALRTQQREKTQHLSACEQALAKRQERLSGLTVDLRSTESRIRMLTEMEKDFEGYNRAVKAVMHAAEKGTLRGVRGPVANLIKTGDRYALAIETALGAAAQNIVVETQSCGAQAIELLRRRDTGRATFLPLDTIRPMHLNSVPDQEPGYVGVADTLVTCAAAYRDIVSNLLGRTVVAETMKDAIAISRRYDHRYRIVTLDGQLVNAGGSLTGGSAAKGSGILSRANELKRLRETLDALTLEKQQCALELEDAQAALDAAHAQLDTVQAQLEQAVETLHKAQSEAAQVVLLQNAAQETIAGQNASIDACRAQQKTNQERIAAARADAASAEETLAQLRTERDQSELGRGAFDRRRQELAERLAGLRAETASLDAERETILRTTQQIHDLFEEMAGDRKARLDQIAQAETGTQQLQQTLQMHERRLAELRQRAETLRGELAACSSRKLELEGQRTRTDRDAQARNRDLLDMQGLVSRFEQKKLSADMEEKQILDKLWDNYELSRTAAEALRQPIENMSKASRRIAELRRGIGALGTPNLGAIDEFTRVNTRYTFLTGQRDDILKAKRELTGIIADVTGEMEGIFTTQFQAIDQAFRQTFLELFGGGKAALVLEDPEHVLDSGIEIKVQPPGKALSTLSLMSGGEMAFVAIALYFAILKVRPTPFCVMDEIEAALDEANVTRYVQYMRRLAKSTQFLVITHRRGTMEEADHLFGVTMQEKGVSRIIELSLDEAAKTIS